MTLAIDTLPKYGPDLDTPAEHAFSVTPSDTNELAYVTRQLYVGVTGDVTVILYRDTTPVLFKSVPGGTTLRIRVKQVMSAGTNASQILALY